MLARLVLERCNFDWRIAWNPYPETSAIHAPRWTKKSIMLRRPFSDAQEPST